MAYKIFQIVLTTLVVIFTVSGLVLLFSGFSALLAFFSTGTGGISAVAGGVSLRWLQPIVGAVAVLFIGVYVVSRWRALHK